MHTAKLRAAPAPANTPDEDGRTGLRKEALKQSFLEHLFYLQGKFPALATRKDYYMALAYVVRDRMLQAPESFDFHMFNRGDYYGAVNSKVVSENITKVLYPNDESFQGKELRLEQQFFFVSSWSWRTTPRMPNARNASGVPTAIAKRGPGCRY